MRLGVGGGGEGEGAVTYNYPAGNLVLTNGLKT